MSQLLLKSSSAEGTSPGSMMLMLDDNVGQGDDDADD